MVKMEPRFIQYELVWRHSWLSCRGFWGGDGWRDDSFSKLPSDHFYFTLNLISPNLYLEFTLTLTFMNSNFHLKTQLQPQPNFNGTLISPLPSNHPNLNFTLTLNSPRPWSHFYRHLNLTLYYDSAIDCNLTHISLYPWIHPYGKGLTLT